MQSIYITHTHLLNNMKLPTSSLLLLLSLSPAPIKSAEYKICGTSYLNAKSNCLTNPHCDAATTTLGNNNDCPPEFPTCFTILSSTDVCGEEGVISSGVGGGVLDNSLLDAIIADSQQQQQQEEEEEVVMPEETTVETAVQNTNNNEDYSSLPNYGQLASTLGNNLILSINMHSNFNHDIDCASHNADWGLCYSQSFAFRYVGSKPYSTNFFRIYFSSIHRLLHVDHPDFTFEHVVGDLTYIAPTESFTGFEPGREEVIPVIFEYWSVQETDKMPRFFVVDTRDNSTEVLPNTDTEDMHDFVIPYTSSKKTEGDGNVPMTVENRFVKNEQLLGGEGGGDEVVDTSVRIIPTPLRVEVEEGAEVFDVMGVSLVYADLLGVLQSGAEELIETITMRPTSMSGHPIELVIGPLPIDIEGEESYLMTIEKQGTLIIASDAKGLFYGVMSFLGLLDISNSRGTMPMKEMTIYDKPRFSYRGHQIDAARNFRTKESVLQTIDSMALYKLNNLHFGLSNDEGWRLEIPGLEELTTVGSKRCFDMSEETCILTQLGSGPDASTVPQYYSVSDFVEILQYAAARNVKIAPEFNMPGHARAAVVAMEARAKKGDDSYRLMDPEDETELLTVKFYDRSSIINPCLDSSITFVEKLVDEVVKMYAEAQVVLDVWQYGGDEAKNILLGGGYSSYDLPKELPFSRSPACLRKMQQDPTISVDIDAANFWALKVNEILAQRGIREMLAWEDGLNGMTKEEFVIEEVSVNFWSTLFWGGTDVLAETSKTGFGVVLANPDYLYFDFPYEVHPEERGYYWAARENSVAKVFSFAPENLPQNAETSLDRDGNAMDITTPVWPSPMIKGMQGQTWSETVRTEPQHQEMTYPRVLAVAERAWHRGSWELDWTPNQSYNENTSHVPKDQLATDFKGFNTVLGCREVRKIWQRLGIMYRVPPPGAMIDGGMLVANTELPCTRIQYSVDTGASWSEYLAPVDVGVGKHVSLKSLSADGGLESRVVMIDQEGCSGCEGVCESDALMPFNTPQVCSSDDSPTVSFPILNNSDPTSPPSVEQISVPDTMNISDQCRFCEGGIPDPSILPPTAGGQTCGQVKVTSVAHIHGDQLCDIIQSVEKDCCPEPVDANPCTFCDAGIPDLTILVQQAGGNTCGEVRELAANHVEGDLLCNSIKNVESTCCPEITDPCTFCVEGVSNPTAVLAEAGRTCEEVYQSASDHSNGDATCNIIQSVENKCCPERTNTCAFCEGGVSDPTFVVPETNGQTCLDIKMSAANQSAGDAVCNAFQAVEHQCCLKMTSNLADNLILKIEMDSNFGHDIDCASHKADWGLCYSQRFVFEYEGIEAHTDNNFRIYFSSIHRLLHVDHPDFKHGHVVGDLTFIEPTESFTGFESSSELVLPVVFEYWSVQETDKMPRFFVVDTRDSSSAVIPNTDTENMHDFVVPYTSSKKTEGDRNVPMTAENRYERNEKLSEGVEMDTSMRIIPTPLRVEVDETAGTFIIDDITLINADLLGSLKSGAEELIDKIITRKPTPDASYNLILTIGNLPNDITGDESYIAQIREPGTTITASDERGLFYGVMSFLGLLDISNSSGNMPMKEMTIYDKPRFSYRGHQIDAARNFRTKESVLQTIDSMALYKLNNLHFGLSNDEGWRLEIPGLEELTTVGSKRCFDMSEETCILTQLGSGPDASTVPQYYSVSDFVEILQYAAARNVKIAPEFNMPGHARAAVVAMEARAKKGDDSYRLMDPEDETELLTVKFYDRSSIINPCLDSSITFVEKLVDEVVKMYAEAQVVLDVWQYGGDEAKNILLGGGYSSYDLPKELPFSRSPACLRKMQQDPTISVDIDAANFWALKVNEILAQRGIREMLAWEDGLNGMTKEEFVIEEVSVNFWSTLFWGGTDVLAETSKTGFGVVLANPDYLYFDFPYEVHPEERGYYWAARENSVAKVFSFAPENLPQNAETSLDRDGNAMDITTPVWPSPMIKGMQGQTWSETVRTEPQHQEMTYPRVLAVAERAWHRGSWELDWTPNQSYNENTSHVPKDQLATDFKGFNTVLGCREVRKIWQRLGIMYRVPPPGAMIDGGMLVANTELPCTRIQYSVDTGASWSEYLAPVDVGVGKHVSLKSLSADGGLESRVVMIDQEGCSGCEGVCESDALMPFNTPQVCGISISVQPPPPSTSSLLSSSSTPPPTMPPFASVTNVNFDSDQVAIVFENPKGNEFFCGDMFTSITGNCLSAKPCPGGLSSICGDDNDETTSYLGCFRVAQCTAEYEAAGATSTEAYEAPQATPTVERCRICGEQQIHAENTVFFEGEEFLCREFDGVFNEGGRGADSSSCTLAKQLYTGTCCITSDDSNAVPSPVVPTNELDYPTLWIMNSSDVRNLTVTLSLASAFITFFFMIYV